MAVKMRDKPNPRQSNPRQYSPRQLRLIKKTRQGIEAESGQLAARIRSRSDYTKALDPFLDTLARSLFPADVMADSPKPTVFTTCIQAPLELFHAAGIRPFRLACGSHAACDTAPLHLPALTCPVVKSLSGLMQITPEMSDARFVIPLTCDWVVRLAQLTGIDQTGRIHYLDLPRLREDERAADRWLTEIRRLKTVLETIAQKKIRPGDLLTSVRRYARAFHLFGQLTELRRNQALPPVYFALMANALPHMDIDEWIDRARDCTAAFIEADALKTPVFLTGSPILFPNYKLLDLIDGAGMTVAGDDLCTMERVFPGAVTWEDRSEFALLRALSQRHHTACSCPTFADNGRRINALVSALIRALAQSGARGVICHVLKGCHPFDMESGILERAVREKGFRFLRIETDYVKEDEQNLVTRLEAFSRTLTHK